MFSWRNLQRLLVPLLLLVSVWQGYQLNQLRQSHRRVLDRLEVFATENRSMLDAIKSMPSAPLPSQVFVPTNPGNMPGGPALGPDGLPIERGGGSSQTIGGARAGARGMVSRVKRARGRNPPLPGSKLMNRMYDAADQLASEEGWDDYTYNEVAVVFEDTSEQMRMVFQDLKDQQISGAQAREEVLFLRDDAQDRLATLIGEDGLDRLKDRFVEPPP